MRQAIAHGQHLGQLAHVGDHRRGLGVGQAIFQRLLAEQREQRQHDRAHAIAGEVAERELGALAQEHARRGRPCRCRGRPARWRAASWRRGAGRTSSCARCRRHSRRSAPAPRGGWRSQTARPMLKRSGRGPAELPHRLVVGKAARDHAERNLHMYAKASGVRIVQREAGHSMSIAGYLQTSISLLQDCIAHASIQNVERAVTEISRTFDDGKPLLVCGNGGSASDASHITGELVGRFLKERRALNCICLSSNSAVLTAWANDYSYDSVFARQVEAYGVEGATLLGLSASGNSKNVVEAFKSAKAMGMATIALTGDRRRHSRPICRHPHRRSQPEHAAHSAGSCLSLSLHLCIGPGRSAELEEPRSILPIQMQGCPGMIHYVAVHARHSRQNRLLSGCRDTERTGHALQR